MSDYERMSLENVNGGQVVALFERELGKVLENIADENTSGKTVRTITLTIKIRPEEDRGSAVVEVEGHSKLAPVKPSKSFAVFSYDGSKVTAYQSDPKQLKLGDMAGAALENGDGKLLKMPGVKVSGNQ